MHPPWGRSVSASPSRARRWYSEDTPRHCATTSCTRTSLSSVTDRSPRLRNDPWTWIGLVCAIAFVLLAVVVNERDAVGFDDPVIAFVQGLPVPTDVWLALTAAGAGILIPFGIAVVVTLVLQGRVRTAVIYGSALIGAALWTSVVKVSVGRVRPPEGALVEASGFSFPSGHTLNSTVTYGLIALLVWRSDLSATGTRAQCDWPGITHRPHRPVADRARRPLPERRGRRLARWGRHRRPRGGVDARTGRGAGSRHHAELSEP